jgi:hypothetical protein
MFQAVGFIEKSKKAPQSSQSFGANAAWFFR